MNAADIANLINYAFVLFFGIIAAFYMADLPFEEHHRLYALTLPGFSAIQLVCYLLFGQTVVYKCYPLLIHLPLILLIRFVCHRNTYISIIAVLAAYLFCTPRKWFADRFLCRQRSYGFQYRSHPDHDSAPAFDYPLCCPLYHPSAA